MSVEMTLPCGWKISNLGSACLIQSGMGFPKNYQGKTSGDYPVFKVGDISKSVLHKNSVLKIADNYVSKLEANALKGVVFENGSTLFAKIGEAVKLNRRAFLQTNGLADNNVMGVKPYLSKMDRFVYHFLCTVDLGEASRSTTVPSIRKSDIENIELAYPPLAEQHQIAQRLDQLLAQVDTIKARLNAIPAILKRFRQSVLSAAVSGKLTLSKNELSDQDIVSPLTIGPEIHATPSNWKWRKLTDLAILESGHTPRKSVPEYWENGNIPWISLQDIREAHGKIIHDTKFKPNIKGIENSSARLLPAGTVCFSRDISVGFTTIMGISMSTTQHFANWICKSELSNKYLMYCFMAAKDHLTSSGQGTTVKTIYMPALKELMILVPEINIQVQIVQKIELLLQFSDKLEEQLKQAQARVNLLTQSILAKAFRGELTADWRAEHPELISGENSAEALLAKIQAAKAAFDGKKTRKKTI